MHNWLKTGRLLAKTTSNNIDETVASSSTIESQQVILKDAIPSCSITNVIEKNSHSNISEKSIVVPEIIELKSSKKRKYDESYLQFGFIPVGTENELQLTTNIKKIVIEHLENLEKSFSQYFPATNNDVDWIQNPFVNQKKPAINLNLDL
ncbi:hypothetical protein QTP88_008025 [Uroleucon formosanum]